MLPVNFIAQAITEDKVILIEEDFARYIVEFPSENRALQEMLGQFDGMTGAVLFAAGLRVLYRILEHGIPDGLDALFPDTD